MQKKRIIFYCHDQNTNLLKSGSLEERKKNNKRRGEKTSIFRIFSYTMRELFCSKTENGKLLKLKFIET